MAGLSSLLNIAKVGLITHQTSLQTIGHNVANVNTKGYSKQDVVLSAQMPTPTAIGPIGNGVEATQIVRNYDRFITTTLFSKASVSSGLETRQSSMKLVEGVLNEVDENGLNELLNQFWNAWDDVANNAEGIAERTTLLQRATLLVQGLTDRYNTLLKLSQDLDLNIETGVKDINQLADQIAELNVQIVSMESDKHQANDLRDQRDELLRRLSELADVHYFETQRGSYTVLIGQGSPLVEDNQSWHLELRGGQVNWIGKNGETFELTSEDVSHGKLGGWLDIKSRISPKDPTVLTGSVVNTSKGLRIRGSTRWDAIDGVTVTGDFTIHFSGTDEDGLPVNGTFTYTYPGSPPPPNEANATVQDFLNAIEQAFQDTSVSPPIDRVRAGITDDGRIVIEDLMPGEQPISFQIESIDGHIYGLDLGKFDFSYPLNYLEQLNKIGQEIIKTVNNQHAQGVGLVPLTETTGIYSAQNPDQPIGLRSSGLKFSSEVQEGQFEIWLYDEDGNVIDFDPTTPEVNDPLVIYIHPDHTTIYDIRDAINNATMPGTGTGAGLKATVLEGKLVIQVSGETSTRGFAFGKDNSGALMTLGVNAFFTGYDASTIGLNEKLIEDQRLVAAAQVHCPGDGSISSGITVQDEQRPLGISFQSGSFTIRVYDLNRKVVDQYRIPVSPSHDSVQDIVNAINQINGLEAQIFEGRLKVRVTEHFHPQGSQMEAQVQVADKGAILKSAASGLTGWNLIQDGSFYVNRYGADGTLLDRQAITINSSSTTLEDIRRSIDALDGLSAQIIDNRLVITPWDQQEYITLSDDTSHVLELFGLTQVDQYAVTLGEDGSGALSYMGILPGHQAPVAASGVVSANAVVDDTAPLASDASGLKAYSYITSGTITVTRYDLDTGATLTDTITVSGTTSLNDLASSLDSLTGISSYVSGHRLYVEAADGYEVFALDDDFTNVLGVLGLDSGRESIESVLDPASPLMDSSSGLDSYGQVQAGTFKLYLYDSDGIVTSTHTIIIDSTTTLEDLRAQLDSINGVSATIRPTVVGGVTCYRLTLASTDPGTSLALDQDTSGLLDAIGLGKMAPEITGRYDMDRTNEPLENFDLSVSYGSFNIYLYDEQGHLFAQQLTGSLANTEAGAPITPSTQWQDIDGVTVNGTFTISYSGINQAGESISGSITASGGDTVNGLLTAIENSFGTTVDADIDDQGRLIVESLVTGQPVSFQINGIWPVDPDAGDLIQGLSFGRMSGSYNIEVDATHDGLTDVADRIDSLSSMRAWAEEGRIFMETQGHICRFVLAQDTSGLLEATGLFTPRGGGFDPANNLNALAIRDLNRMTIQDMDDATLNEAYQALVGTVGIHSRGFQLDYEFSQTTLNELEARRDAISGVSLDEEMANLIKFQHAYSAAAKLISAADEMLMSLLQAK